MALRSVKTQELVSDHAHNNYSLIHIFLVICCIEFHGLVVIDVYKEIPSSNPTWAAFSGEHCSEAKKFYACETKSRHQKKFKKKKSQSRILLFVF